MQGAMAEWPGLERLKTRGAKWQNETTISFKDSLLLCYTLTRFINVIIETIIT
jgi:hypothetical protein